MANVFQVIDMVTREALRIAHEKGAFLGTVDRQYDDRFKSSGGAIGDTLRVRYPNEYKVRTGQTMSIQEQDERSGTITRASMKGVDMSFTTKELLDSVNSGAKFDDLSKNYIEPAVSVLISDIEQEALEYCTKATWNAVGTPGTAITDLTVPGLARARLNKTLAPKDMNRCIQMESVAMGNLVSGTAAYFNPNNAIGKQYREGMVARTSMADYFENERIWVMTNAADVAGAVNQVSFTSGANSLTVDGFTAAPAVGGVFTIDGVFAVHPETKQTYSHLQQFTVTAATTTSITFSPAIISDTTHPRQNVSAAPADNAAITFIGAASTSYAQHLMYHKEAFQFVTADLPILDDVQKCKVMRQENLSIRTWMASSITDNKLLMRLDVLYGIAALRPEWACRMIGDT